MDTLWISMAKYDEFDNIIEYDEFQNNTLCRKEFTKYNKNNIKIEKRDFFLDYNDGDISCRSNFWFYNSNGDPTVAYGFYYCYCGYGEYYHYEDDEGESYGEYEAYASHRYWHKKYDEKGNLTEELLQPHHDGCRTPIIDGKYNDEEAKKIEKEFKNTKEFDSKTEYVYTFDKYGNWITKATYEQKGYSMPVCTGIVEREIEYYE